jgi:hypothetical protein
MTYLDLLSSCEFWTGMNDGDITDNTELKATFTNRLNRSLDKYMGMAGASSSLAKIDDTNFDNQPFSYFDIEEEQHDYQFLYDEDLNSISDFTAVFLKIGTSYHKLDRISLDHEDAEKIMSPDADITGTPIETGTPTRYVERNNTIFLDPVPSTIIERGGKIFYKRAPSYFATTDSVKEPGLPFNFHDMLAVDASYAWLLVHKSNALVEISRVENELQRLERDFKTYNELRNPQKHRIIGARHNTR